MSGHRNTGLRAALTAAVFLLGGQVHAAPVGESGAEVARVSYASVSDEDLTAIAARWDDLNAQQRRALLSEVRLRMRRSGSVEGVLGTGTVRRYGTVVRRSNGARATLRVEVRTGKKRADQTFGVGFEQRASGVDAKTEAGDPPAPVVKVADPDK